jgi:LEA14-like dessication related protein
MNTRKFIVFLLASLALVACANLPSLDFQNLKEPKVSLVGLRLGKANLAAQKFLVTLQLDNPNSQGFNVNGIDLAVALNGKKLAEGATTRPLSLEGGGSSTVEVAAVANALAMLEQAMVLTQKKAIDYEVSGHLNVLPGVFSWVRLPLSYKGTLTWEQLQRGIQAAQGMAR